MSKCVILCSGLYLSGNCFLQTRPPDIVSPLPSVLLEECDIPGFGRFTAHSSGHVRVIFPDRTCLDMYADFQKRIGICEQHSDTEVGRIHTDVTL